MSAPAPTRGLLTLGALSTGLIYTGVTFEIPLLRELWTWSDWQWRFKTGL